MIPRLYTTAFISIITLLSCAGNDKSNDFVDKSLITPSSENKKADTPANPVQIMNTQPGITVGNTVTPATNTVNINPDIKSLKLNPQTFAAPPIVTTTQAGNVKLNPAHGQPGHRCDIQVGAPLDSKPIQPTAQPAANISTTTQPPVTINTQPATTQPTAPGMNPPHGQPGHRCDISVGAPLNSPPAQTATPAPTAVVPVKADSAKKQ